MKYANLRLVLENKICLRGFPQAISKMFELIVEKVPESCDIKCLSHFVAQDSSYLFDEVWNYTINGFWIKVMFDHVKNQTNPRVGNVMISFKGNILCEISNDVADWKVNDKCQAAVMEVLIPILENLQSQYVRSIELLNEEEETLLRQKKEEFDNYSEKVMKSLKGEL